MLLLSLQIFVSGRIADRSFIEEEMKEIAQRMKQRADAEKRETLRREKEAAAKAAKRKKNTTSADFIESS